MAVSRKEALRRLYDLVARVEEHMQLLADEPDSWAARGWRAELRAWLDKMQSLTRFVGKKTAAQWDERIAQWRKAAGL